MQVILEKIEGGEAVLSIVGDKQNRTLAVPVEFLPDGIRVQDCAEVAILPDVKRLKDVQAEIDRILASGFSIVRPLGQSNVTRRVRHKLDQLVRKREQGYVLVNLDHAAEEIARAIFETE